MGSEQFSTAVRGSGGRAIQTNAEGVVETNNYGYGEGFEVDPSNGDTYPHEIDPTTTIEHLRITETGTRIRADLVTTTGDKITDVALRGATLAEDSIELDSVTLRDPNGTGAATYGYWSGKQ